MGSSRRGGARARAQCARWVVRRCGGASSSSRERRPLPGRGTNCRRGGCASAASHLYTSCKGGIYGALWAHARGPVRSWGVRRCGASLACLCARLSASRGSETPACEASPAALGATHGVVRMPAAARGRAAARGLTDESRLARRGASGAARAGPASVVPGAPPAVAHSAVRVRSAAAHGRWSLYGMRGAWVEGGQVRALRARSSLAAEGALPRASARRSALERHERALQKGEGWDSRDRALASFFQRAANINYDPPGLGWSSGPLQRAPPPRWPDWRARHPRRPPWLPEMRPTRTVKLLEARGAALSAAPSLSPMRIFDSRPARPRSSAAGACSFLWR